MVSSGAVGPTNLIVQTDQHRELAPISKDSGYGGYGTTTSNRELSLALLWRIAVEWRGGIDAVGAER